MNSIPKQLRRGTPDPLGVRTARAVQDALPETGVILFGSRARGDHRPNSDVDIVVIISNSANPNTAEAQARKAVNQLRKQEGIAPGCDILVMNEDQFQRNRLAKQHAAGQADTQGAFMSGERLERRYHHEEDCEDEYPAHWPETRRRIENTLEFSHHFNQMVDENDPIQKIMGFCAQQAVENALKGWLSAYNDQRNWGHEFGSLWQGIQQQEDFSQPELQETYEKVTDLFDATSSRDPQDPAIQLNWLEKYAVTHHNHGTWRHMTQDERLKLQEKVNGAVESIISRIHKLSGTTDADLFPGSPRPWQ